MIINLNLLYRTQDIANYSVPFICQLNKDSVLVENSPVPCLVDPLRALGYKKNEKFYCFTEIAMHHMTGFRSDFNNKLDNSITNSSQQGVDFIKNFRKKHNQLSLLKEEDLLKQGYITVENIFNIKEF